MIRSKLSGRLCGGLLLVCCSSFAFGQDVNTIGGWDGPKAEVGQSWVNDPEAADMLFKEGEPIVSVLEELKKKGFPIEYKKKQFSPAMTLLTVPTATQIDDVLQEILEPWAFQVHRSGVGKLIVSPEKKSKEQLALEAEAKKQ